jgi:inner membrane protein
MDIVQSVGVVVRSPAVKFLLILFLILLLTIPSVLVIALVEERVGRAREVRVEVGGQWGPEQAVLGPFLLVPYTIRVESVQGDKRVEQILERRAVFTPEVLDVTGTADARTLRRSIFEVPVYAAKLKLAGRFGAPRIEDVASSVVAVRWQDAVLALGLSGVSGLKEAATVEIAGATAVPFAPSIGYPTTGLTGIHAKLAGAGPTVLPAPDQPPRPFAFTIDLVLNGSVTLTVAPVARETGVALSSDWPHPSFTGAFLPDRRTIEPTGFTASWRVPHLARSVPESWNLQEAGLERLQPHAFGVVLVDPVGFYALVNRAAKYAILFVTLAFMAVFCIELGSRDRVHPVQYLFAGLALVFFYVLLLSLAEHIGFAAAYLAASIATGVMLAIYIGATVRSVRWGVVMLAVFGAIYAILYTILQLEDYALLAGAILGFVALTVVMFTTLRVDWSGSTRP